MIFLLSYVKFEDDVNLGDTAHREGLPRIETSAYIYPKRLNAQLGAGREDDALRIYLDTDLRMVHVVNPLSPKAILSSVPVERCEILRYAATEASKVIDRLKLPIRRATAA